MGIATLKGLNTIRNRWSCDVELYKTGDDAKSDGFHLMYEDAEGSVYGIADPEKFGRWKEIAFVPHPEHFSKYRMRSVG